MTLLSIAEWGIERRFCHIQLVLESGMYTLAKRNVIESLKYESCGMFILLVSAALEGAQ
jgi:hypothetical protein